MPTVAPPRKEYRVNEVRAANDDVRPLPASLAANNNPRVISSAEILQGDREILILHGDSVYRLRVTRANRLILNK
jgi:hemin uptake protein HemP